MDAQTTVDTKSDWRWLYRLGGIAALTIVALIPIQIVVYVVSPPPDTVAGFYELFQRSTLLGLLSLDLLLIIDWLLFIPLFLALYVVLRHASSTWMAVGLVSGLLAIAIYFASTVAIEMLSLSDLYATATTEAERTLALAAGEGMMVTYTGTAFHVSYILGSLAGLIIAAVMLRGPVFGRVAAYVGIASNILALGLYVPAIGLVLSILSAVGLGVWYALIGWKLLRFA